MARSKEEVCNKALIKLGKKPTISNLEKGTSTEERVFNAIFDTVKRRAIRRYRPNCCVARADLSQDPNYTPRNNYSSGYLYPENMVRLLEVGNEQWGKDDTPIEGKWILTHLEKAKEPGDSAPKLSVKYLEDKSVDLLDDDFINLLSLELALEASPTIDMTREATIKALRDLEADDWATDNAMENGFTVEEYDPLFDTVRTIRS